jgi:hypothetical protein
MVDTQIKLDTPAVLRKWPSFKNERLSSSKLPYSVMDGTLRECIRAFIAKPDSQRHLYEIHTGPQGEIIGPVMGWKNIVELAQQLDLRYRL